MLDFTIELDQADNPDGVADPLVGGGDGRHREHGGRLDLVIVKSTLDSRSLCLYGRLLDARKSDIFLMPHIILLIFLKAANKVPRPFKSPKCAPFAIRRINGSFAFDLSHLLHPEEGHLSPTFQLRKHRLPCNKIAIIHLFPSIPADQV